MTSKAYIVANEQQEREVLEKLEREGLVWTSGREATEWIPSQRGLGILQFPYSLVDVGYVAWRSIEQLGNYEIVYDGRKEERMSEKYVVSQEFMNELEEWKIDYLGNDIVSDIAYVSVADIDNLPSIVCFWWINSDISAKEDNNRLIAIIRWVNGEDVFEVDKPKKWIVRSKEVNDDGDKHYWKLLNLRGVLEMTSTFELRLATKFDTKEEAESWANTHQEVIEVEE
jgi:sorbitol-specific phosphotransferase system component IIA